MRWFRLIATVAAFGTGAWAAWWMQGRLPADFVCFWTAARHAWSPYDPQWIRPFEQADSVALPFAYPPVFLLIIYPFGFLPLKLAYCLWSGATLSLLVFTATFVARIGAPLLLLSAPVMIAAAMGQSTLLLGSLIVGGMYLLDRRPRLAGVLLALAVCIKPQAMLAAPIVLWGRWDTVKAAVLASVGFVLASFVFGPERWLEWVEAITAFPKWFANVHLVGPTAAFRSLWWRLLVAGLGVVLALRRNLMGLLAGTLCFTPYAQMYDLAPLCVVGAAWIGRWKEGGVVPALVGAALVFTLVQWPLTVFLILLAMAAIELRLTPFSKPAALSLT
jgi:hypothetical protein